MECGGEVDFLEASGLLDMVDGGGLCHVGASGLLDVAHFSSCDADEDDQGGGIRPKSSPRPRRRSSSSSEDLDQDPPPCLSRRVSFADTFGLSLVSIKEFDAWSLPIPPGLSALEVDAEAQTEFTLSCLFSVPGSEMELVQTLLERKIELERMELLPGTTVLRGIVRVINLCFNKAVYIRTTLDGWNSHFDLLAEYVSGSSDGKTDSFSFRLTLVPPLSSAGTRVEFCLRYETPVGTFWANNNGSNYVLFCTRRGEVQDAQFEEVHHRTKRSCLKSVSKEPSMDASAYSDASPSIHPDPSLHHPDAPKQETVRKSLEVRCSEAHREDDRQKSLMESKQNRKRRRAARLTQIQDHFAQRDRAAQSWRGDLDRREEHRLTPMPHDENGSSLPGGTESGTDEQARGTVSPYNMNGSSLPGGTESGVDVEVRGTISPYNMNGSSRQGGTESGVDVEVRGTVSPYNTNGSSLPGGTESGTNEQVRGTVSPYNTNGSSLPGGTESGVDVEVRGTVSPYNTNSSSLPGETESGTDEKVEETVIPFHSNSSSLLGGTESSIGNHVTVAVTPHCENVCLSQEAESIMTEKLRTTVSFSEGREEHLTNRQGEKLMYEHSFPVKVETAWNSQPTIILRPNEQKETEHGNIEDALSEHPQTESHGAEGKGLYENQTDTKGTHTIAHIVPKEQPTALHGPLDLENLFDGSTVSHWDAYPEITTADITSSISKESHEQDMGATRGERATSDAEHLSESPLSSMHPSFTFETFVAPLYQQAFYRIAAESWDINKDGEEEDKGDDKQSEKMGGEAQTHILANKTKASASKGSYHHFETCLLTHTDVSASLDKTQSSEEKCPEVCAGQTILNTSVPAKTDFAGNGNENSGLSLQAAVFCFDKTEKNSFKGNSSDKEDKNTEVSCTTQAAEPVKHPADVKGDSFAVLKPVNASSETRALREESGDGTLCLCSDGETESTVNKTRVVLTDLCEENQEEILTMEVSNGKNEASSGKRDEDKKRELVKEQNDDTKKERSVFKEIVKPLEVKDLIFSDEIEILNKEFLTTKEDFLVLDKEETFVGKFREAFSEVEDEISSEKECFQREKACMASKGKISININDTSVEKQTVSVKRESLVRGDREVNKADVCTKTSQNVSKATEVRCGERQRTEQQDVLKEENINWKMLCDYGKEEGNKDVLREKQIVYNTELERAARGHDIVKEEKEWWKEGGKEDIDVFMQKKTHRLDEGCLSKDRNDDTEKKTNSVRSNHVSKAENGTEFHCSKENVNSFNGKNDDTRHVFTVNKDNLKTSGRGEADLLKQTMADRHQTHQLSYRENDGDESGVREEHVQEKAVDDRCLLIEEKVHICEGRRVLYTETQEVTKEGDHNVGNSRKDEEVGSDMETCASEEEEGGSTDSLTDDEMEQYLLGVKAVQKSPQVATTCPGDVLAQDSLPRAGKRPSASRGARALTALSSISESPEEDERQGDLLQGLLAALGEPGSPSPDTPLPVEGEESAGTNDLPWMKACSSGDVSNAAFWGVLVAVFLVIAYYYDFIACFALYLFSVFCLCCHGEKHRL